MKIAIDIRSLQDHNRFRGIGFYLSNLLLGISEVSNPSDDFVFVIDVDKKDPTKDLDLDPKFVFSFLPGTKPLKKFEKAFKKIVRSDFDADNFGIDAFLQPDIFNGLPKMAGKKVAVFHDLIPLIFKDQYFPFTDNIAKKKQSFIDWHIYKHYLNLYKNCDRIISVSKSSSKDLLKYGLADRRKLSVVYSAGEKEVALPKITTQLKNKLNLNKSFMLYIGSCDFRKNISDLIKAAELVGDSAQLVLVGKDFEPDLVSSNIRSLLANSSMKNNIITTGFIDNPTKAWLYQNATAFVFPSLYEGFGLPILEAMQNKCPVITYNNSSLPEVAGNAAVYASSPAEIAENFIKLRENNSFRQALIKKGLIQSKSFDWNKTAEKYLSILKGTD